MWDEIVCVENIDDFQATYSILKLNLSNLINIIVCACRQDYFNILDLKVFFHLLRDVSFTNEKKALKLCNKLLKYIKCKSFSYFKKKMGKLRNLIKGDYQINGSVIEYKNNNKPRWDTTVSFILKESIMEMYPEVSFSH